SHAIDQKNQIAPEADELEPPRRGRLVVAGRGLMTARTNRCGPFPWSYRDENGLLVLGEAGLSVDKSRDGMAYRRGNAHAARRIIGRPRPWRPSRSRVD